MYVLIYDMCICTNIWHMYVLIYDICMYYYMTYVCINIMTYVCINIWHMYVLIYNICITTCSRLTDLGVSITNAIPNLESLILILT